MGRFELRCADADLSTWKAVAEARGFSLSRFVRDLLDDALSKELLAGASQEANGTPNVPEPVVVSEPPDAVPTLHEEVERRSIAALPLLPMVAENDDVPPPAFPPIRIPVPAKEPEERPISSWLQRLAADAERQS